MPGAPERADSAVAAAPRRPHTRHRYYTNGEVLKAAYEAYRAETAPLIVCCPAVYKVLPGRVQCLCCCEYEQYAYNETKDQIIQQV